MLAPSASGSWRRNWRTAEPDWMARRADPAQLAVINDGDRLVVQDLRVLKHLIQTVDHRTPRAMCKAARHKLR